MRFAIAAVAVICCCACAPVVRHDAGEGFDPAAYGTYRIADTAALRAQHPTAYNQLVDDRVRAAIQAELTARGYTPIEAGAADLELVIRIRQRSQLRSGGGVGFGFGVGASSGGARRTGVGVGVGSGGGRADEEILVDLVIDLNDAEGTLLWQGLAENGLSEYRRRDDARVRETVAAIFDQPPLDARAP